MEAMLSEFDYFTPTITQSAITAQYYDEISPTNPLNSSVANPVCTLEFKIPASTDLYRDLSNSFLMIKCKLTKADGADLTNAAAIAPANLFAHALWSNVAVNLCGKELSDKDSLYPYRAMFETLLTYDKNVQETRCLMEGFAKDDASKMDAIAVDGSANSGFMKRRAMAASSRAFTLYMRPHVDLFHQGLSIPPNCGMSIKFTPSPGDFVIMEANNGTTKVALLDAKMYVMTKKGTPELVLAQKQMLAETNMRFQMNRVVMQRYGIAAGFQSIGIPLSFPGKLPKRIFIAFAANAVVTGVRARNPFNFENFGMKSLTLTVNGVEQGAKQLDYATGDYQSAYLNLLSTLGLDIADRSINISVDDYPNGYTIYGFQIAPGPIDGTVQSVANSVGSIVANVNFAAAPAANVDMLVYAETPGVLEIDKLSAVTIM